MRKKINKNDLFKKSRKCPKVSDGNKACDVPLFELRVDDSVGETLTTDSDALKHTVTLQLVQDQLSIHDT